MEFITWKKDKSEEIIKIPVYNTITVNEEGEMTGEIVDYVRMPKSVADEYRRG